MGAELQKRGRMEKEKINDLARQLGMTSMYNSYFYVTEALKIRIEIQRPYRITKDIYQVLAVQYSTKSENVESGIRRVSRFCWTYHRDLLIQMAGYTLEEPPTNRQFIDILASYIMAS